MIILGLVEPSQFMPMAEHSEIIDELTGHICRLAIEQCRQWYAAGLPVGVAINISARNLHDLRFPATLAGWIEAAGLPAHLIEVEVTENTMMADALRSAAVLKRLREFGISVSIDDFGTGHSSLSVLRNESVNWVKIDRSFVTGMAGCAEDAMIVRSIVELAHNLGLRTVAEGVECLDEMAMLQVMGCDLAQGYLFARPSSPSQLEPLLRRGVLDVRATLAVAATAIGLPR